MKASDFPSNKISDIVNYFTSELSSVYENSEAENICFLCLEEILGMQKAEVKKKFNERINQSDLIRLYSFLKKLKENNPIQYILGYSWFFNLKLKVDSSVLIPRPETEELCDIILKENVTESKNVLDIGTGSGCIPLALKSKRPDWNIHALDVSASALEIAKLNAIANKLKVEFIKADIADYKIENGFDILVSNPPYVLESEKAMMEPRVKDKEPSIALFVKDNDPLKFYKLISEKAKTALVVGGKVYFEVNQQYADSVGDLLKQLEFKNVRVIKDLFNNARFVYAENF